MSLGGGDAPDHTEFRQCRVSDDLAFGAVPQMGLCRTAKYASIAADGCLRGILP